MSELVQMVITVQGNTLSPDCFIRKLFYYMATITEPYIDMQSDAADAIVA